MPENRGVSANVFPEGASWVDRLRRGILPSGGVRKGQYGAVGSRQFKSGSDSFLLRDLGHVN